MGGFWDPESWSKAGQAVSGGVFGTAGVIAGTALATEGISGLGSDEVYNRYDERANLPLYGDIRGMVQNDWGGDPNAAGRFTQYGLNGLASTNANRDWFMNNAALGAGTARENQTLSDREAFGAGYDQAGSMQLAREAAMGLAPSEAAYQMQHGLDRAIGNQYAVTGGARGGAGIALAQGNQGANIARLQQDAYTNAGMLRAREMNDARALYNNAANTNRAQDQSRLAIGNQMATGNAGQYNQFMGQMGGLANQADANATNWYGTSMSPYNTQLGANVTGTGQGIDLYNAGRNRDFSAETSRATAKSDYYHGMTNMGGTLLQTGLNAITGQGSGAYNPFAGNQSEVRNSGIGGSSTGDFDAGGKYDPGY